jgi:uncharacterized protein (TIGR01777 family)
VRIVLTGASGLIGTALKTLLGEHGHQVKSLVRHPASGPDEARWDPARGEIDAGFLADADAVVCLSGAGVGDRRWTESYKRTIIDSRVDSVGTVARTLVDHGGPRVLIAASAVGYYGDTGDRLVEEDSPAGSSFLSRVCEQWEAAAEPARAAGVRVVHPRTGLVLAPDGGLLKRLKPLVQLGVAGKLGDGEQYMPWISLRDEVRAIEFLLSADLSGPVNLTGPAPARNADFVSTLGRILHRPTVLPAPGFAIRAALGEFAGEILGGQRAVPAALTKAGFEFEHPDLDSALRWALRP